MCGSDMGSRRPGSSRSRSSRRGSASSDRRGCQPLESVLLLAIVVPAIWLKLLFELIVTAGSGTVLVPDLETVMPPPVSILISAGVPSVFAVAVVMGAVKMSVMSSMGYGSANAARRKKRPRHGQHQDMLFQVEPLFLLGRSVTSRGRAPGFHAGVNSKKTQSRRAIRPSRRRHRTGRYTKSRRLT